MSISNFEEKSGVLKDLVAKAVSERPAAVAAVYPFDVEFINPSLDLLVNALYTSDALDILHEMLSQR